MLFIIALRLGLDVCDVENMSNRQVVGWVEVFTTEAVHDSGAMEYSEMSKADLKAAFR